MRNIIAIVFFGLLFLGACSQDEHVPFTQNYLENLRPQNAMPQPQVALAPQVIQAQVISSTPNFKDVPGQRQECRMIEVPVDYEETVQVEQEVPNDDPGHPVAGTVIGGVIGAAVGNQIGNGSGRDWARALGFIGGAIAGNRAGTPPATRIVPVMQAVQRTRYEQQQQCEEVNGTRQEVDGYTVTYNYQGETMTTTMPNDPGQFVTLVAAR